MSKWLPHILFSFMAFLLFGMVIYMPLLQKADLFQVPRLDGAFQKTETEKLNVRNWSSGKYQKAYEQYLKNDDYLIAPLVRLKSQIDYSLFSLSSNDQVLVGKEDQLYSSAYTEAWLGRDKLTQEDLDHRIQQFEKTHDFFRKNGKQFMVLLPPSKQTFFPEFMPDAYQQMPRKETNREWFVKALSEAKIPCLDFDFLKEKQKDYPEPLYPKWGLHWSLYSVPIVTNHLLEEMMELDTSMRNNIQWDKSAKLEEGFWTTDCENYRSINLLTGVRSEMTPIANVKYASMPDSLRPKVLAIGDSFYEVLVTDGITQKAFHPDSEFWYYNRDVYPEKKRDGKRLKARDLFTKEYILSFDFVLIESAEINLSWVGFSFLENLTNLIKE